MYKYDLNFNSSRSIFFGRFVEHFRMLTEDEMLKDFETLNIFLDEDYRCAETFTVSSKNTQCWND